jgi:hypothetical protein
MTPDDRSRNPSDPPPARELVRRVGELEGSVRDLDIRVHKLDTQEQVHHTELLGKLSNGYVEFERARSVDTDLSRRIDSLEKENKDSRPKKLSLSVIISLAALVGTLLGNIIGIVRTASTYVDRAALEKVVERKDDEVRELRDENASMSGRMIRLEEKLTQVDSARASLATLFESVLEASRASNRSAGRNR